MSADLPNHAPQTAAEMTANCIDLYKHGKVQQAVNLANENIANNPNNGSGYALLSYLAWQQGDIARALNEGETAARLSPNSSVILTNLALMMQRTDQYSEAISLYKRAQKMMPDSWVPAAGIARSYIMASEETKGIAQLKAMNQEPKASFDWYYITAKTARDNFQLHLAEEAAVKAVAQAKTAEQKSAAQNLLMLVLLRDDKSAAARALKADVLANGRPCIGETYVRMLSQLVEPNSPKDGEEIIALALNSLQADQNGQNLLKLGRACEEKASLCDEKNRTPWLDLAQKAYEQALTAPKFPDPYLGLASVYWAKGLPKEASQKLSEFENFNQLDLLAPYVAEKLNAASGAGNSHVANNSLLPLNLTLVTFKIKSLPCACKLAKIQAALQKIHGVAFDSITPHDPYIGTILVDESITSAEDVLAKCLDTSFPKTSDSKDKRPTFEITTKAPIKTIAEALKAADYARHGKILDFDLAFYEYLNRYKDVAPIMPSAEVYSDGGAHGIEIWSLPL